MQYRKPHYYNDFSCVADQCPDTCCAGWQIGIDDESLETYSTIPGGFGSRLRNSINWAEGLFEQYDKRCSILNEKNLCDIYTELGPDALCDTCKMYPRHTEEFENLREFSLALSCPIAAEMILGCKEPVHFLEEEDAVEECEEDYEEFDFLLFERLEEARELIFQVVQNRALDITKRMILILKLSAAFQEALAEGMMFQLDLEKELEKFSQEVCETQEYSRHRNMKAMWKDLRKLEVLREEWTDVLKGTDKILRKMDDAAYQEARKEFLASMDKQQWALYQEQLLMFYIYTYFCGAVYDDMVYTKIVLAVFSAVWIEELLFVRWLEQKKPLRFADVTEIAYQYAREIEHSDENLNLLEDIFWENPLYAPDELTKTLMG